MKKLQIETWNLTYSGKLPPTMPLLADDGTHRPWPCLVSSGDIRWELVPTKSSYRYAPCGHCPAALGGLLPSINSHHGRFGGPFAGSSAAYHKASQAQSYGMRPASTRSPPKPCVTYLRLRRLRHRIDYSQSLRWCSGRVIMLPKPGKIFRSLRGILL